MSLLGDLRDNTSVGYPFDNTSIGSPADNTSLRPPRPNCDHIKSITIPVNLIFIIIGLIGNPLFVILYHHMPIRVASTRVMFVVLAFCDIINLCHKPLWQVIKWYSGLKGLTFYPLFGYVLTVSSSTANVLIAAISVERYVRVFASLPIGRSGNKRTAIIFCTTVVLFFGLLFIGLAIPHGVITTDSMLFYRTHVVYWMIFTTNFITPTIGVVFSNAIFIRQICARKNIQQTLTGNVGGASSHGSKQANSITVSLIVISSLALFCHVPLAVIKLERKTLGHICRLQDDVQGVFVAINHSLNFYIYYMGSIINKIVAKCCVVKARKGSVTSSTAVASSKAVASTKAVASSKVVASTKTVASRTVVTSHM